jgi:hypothetical protein
VSRWLQTAENGGDTFLRNVGSNESHAVPYLRRRFSSYSSPWKPQILRYEHWEEWRRYVPPKRRFTQDRHGATSTKTTFFIVTTVKTSNLTWTAFVCVLLSAY